MRIASFFQYALVAVIGFSPVVLSAAAASDKTAGKKNLDVLIKTFYEISPPSKAKEVEDAVRAPLAHRDKFEAVIEELEKSHHYQTRNEMKEYIKRIALYYHTHADAMASAQKTSPVLSDRLLHLLLEDFSEVLIKGVSEFSAPASHLSVGTTATLKRYSVAIERFIDRRIALYTDRDDGTSSPAKAYDPEADDFLVDNIRYLMTLMQIPIKAEDKNSFNDRDARDVRYFREAIHLLLREINLGVGNPVVISFPSLRSIR